MTLARSLRAAAIVLRARNLGEADRVFTLLSLERGKIDAVAKGIRRGRSALAGRLEFMNDVALQLHRGRTLDIITSAEVVVTHFDAIVAPEAFAAVSLIAEYVDAACAFEQPVPEVFALLRGVLQALERTAAPSALLPRFELRLLQAIGFGPQLDVCVRCGVAIDRAREIWFDFDDGGVACGDCRAHLQGIIELTGLDVANLRALARPAGSALPVALHARARSAEVIDRLLLHHLGPRPRVRPAMDILREL